MKYTFSILFLLTFYVVSAQQVIDVNNENKNIAFKEMLYNVGGQSAVKYVEFKAGSPFFKEDWLPAALTLNNGTSYNGVQGKLDIMTGNVVYKNEAGAELVAQAPIKQIMFTEGSNRYVFLNASSFPGTTSKKVWYQQLVPGSVSLYKQLEKTIVEQRPFNSATTEQSIKTTEKYFLLKDQKLIHIKKSKDALELLSDRSAELKKFDNQKSKSLEKDLVELVSYYNTLSK